MVDWEITATTIYCDAVDDEVTLLAYGDGKAKCTGHEKYGNPSKETAKILKAKSKKLSRELGCTGAECSRLVQYRDRLLGV